VCSSGSFGSARQGRARACLAWGVCPRQTVPSALVIRRMSGTCSCNARAWPPCGSSLLLACASPLRPACQCLWTGSPNTSGVCRRLPATQWSSPFFGPFGNREIAWCSTASCSLLPRWHRWRPATYACGLSAHPHALTSPSSTRGVIACRSVWVCVYSTLPPRLVVSLSARHSLWTGGGCRLPTRAV
jgi:hypothetical protein